MAHLYISVYTQPEEIFYHIIVQTAPLVAYALPDALLPEHQPILSALIRVGDQACFVWNLCKCLVQHGGYHAEHRTRS